jgi:uncharacterized protein (TIGR02284 family)
MLLRDDRQIALSQLEMLCIEAADGYASAVDRTEDTELKQVFAELGTEHSRFAADLAPQIRALDDLPKSPDPDRETIEHALTAVRGFLSGHARETLLADQEQRELKVEEAAGEALEQTLSGEANELVRRILIHAGKARERLLAIHAG